MPDKRKKFKQNDNNLAIAYYRFSSHSQNETSIDQQREQAQDAPRYWLTGKLFCGECGGSMQGVSGTSKTGAKHYYYYCKEQRAKRC